VQSTAIAALIVKGELTPDLAIIVDTERESSTTWEYHNNIVCPALKDVGVKLHRIRKSKYATVDLFSGNTLLVPVYTETGKFPTYCSAEWKVRVLQRWAVREYGVKQATVWLGITVDELKRVKQPIGKWQNHYPLIDRRMSRGDCLALIDTMGWPPPPRSSCWMCPNHTKKEWADQKQKGGSDWDRAVLLEKYLQSKDDEVYLAEPGVSLENMEFGDGGQMAFTGLCDSGYCFT